MTKTLSSIFCFLIFFTAVTIAQDNRAQFPGFLSNTYVGVHAAYISYSFSEKNIETGNHATSITNPGAAVRILLGHQFNKYFSAQISYQRPIFWVEYKNVNGTHENHSVYMNIAGLSLKGNLPVNKKLSVYAEGGLSITTRTGFSLANERIVYSANYTSYLLGAGVQYKFNKRWDAIAGAVYAPGKTDINQPHTILYSLGVNYNLRPLSALTVDVNSKSKFIFPKNLLQIGFATNVIGYGVTDYFTKRPIPIFWDGDVDVHQGISIQYQRNVFHGRKFFSLDMGSNISFWQSKINSQHFFTASVFPLFRFTVLHTNPADIYFNYALAGPSFISATTIDDNKTGEHFTFYDFMGMGSFFGKNKNFNAEIKIAHYSNGNLFFHNPGVTIPLSFNLGYTF